MRPRLRVCFPAVCIALFCAVSDAENDPQLEARLSLLVSEHQGQVSIAIKELDGDVEFRHKADRAMPTASLCKLPVMIETYRQAAVGNIDLEQMIELREEDKVPGSGILTPHFSAGTKISLRDAVRLMMAYSDNTATNLVLDQIGLKSTADTMTRWGLSNTKIHAKVFRRDSSLFPERSQKYGLGSTTASEMLTLLTRLYRQELVSEDACETMLNHLLACQDESKLARFLPNGVKIAHKTGSVSNVRCDAGILYLPQGAVAVCVLTNENQDRSWGERNAAEILCGRVAEAVYHRFADADANPDRPAELQLGATGRLVEELQRTLNVRLEPSPSLAVDGDFGPVTQEAVEIFQRDRKLEVTGIADIPTLKALSPLLSEDQETSQLEALPPLEPADALEGPPFVTCKAWVLIDGSSGELVAEQKGNTSLPMASTTKMMTAYLAFQAIAEEPELADSLVTFSERADMTRGSTSGVRTGEQLPLRELLYGLLLPSGNDASVAIAEHLGSRYSPASDREEDQGALARFIHQMNVTASKLGMENTHYVNPHGLDADDHHASPRDLAILARAAFQLASFRETVGTRRYLCIVKTEDGPTRQVVWNNTNQLLNVAGYDGVKTGTTGDAGACLVSSLHRDDDWLICVVLAAQSSGARYVDSRNLFRWGFQNLRNREPDCQ
ncbi:MAG: serine hydrolase [Planctomycetaceae bacterium]|nr:serine hydrolase [Planctomycetaceae bacterium]